MIPHQYLAAVRAVLTHLENTQLPALDRAADLCVQALQNNGVIYCWEIGHGIQGDFIHRAGGLAAVQHFHCRLDLADKSPAVHARANPDRDLETIRFGVSTSTLRAGDVLLLGSVSGKNRAPVELALACRARGVKTVGLTSLAYTRQVESLHPTGKKLCDVVDVVIDNGAPYGDAAVEIPGYTHKLLPVSGVSCAVAGHMLWGRVLEKMAATGTPATVFQSVNRPTGIADLKAAEKQYNERGY
ncbi:MAG: hypothetical protein PCFJNLEI_02049 [Verrucomicrobiae bacterium]|nr:hypothetical protein [Verrucomicrobiae bacterium]